MSTSAQAGSGSPKTSSTSEEAATIALLAQLPAPEGAVPLIDAAKTVQPSPTLAGLVAGVAIVRNTPGPNMRNRLAGLLVGEIAEEEFARRYSDAMQGQLFSFEDQRAGANETDFLVFDGQKRRAFRINIKAHGTFFAQALKFVGLQPEDTFALATYKIRDANRRSAEEALPFLFAVVSSDQLGAEAVAAGLPSDVAAIADVLTGHKGVKGLRTVENLLVAHMLDPTYHGKGALVQGLRKAVAAASWRVISAVRAEHLMNEKMWERVPAVAKRNFSGSRDSQPNMHFSLSEDMIGLEDFLALLHEHGIQHVATRIAYRQI